MNITTNSDGTTVQFIVEGKLTVQTSPDLEAAIGETRDQERNFDIDLSKVNYVSSAGLRVFVAADKLAMSRGGTMRLLRPAVEVMEVFDMTGLSEVLNIVE